MAEPTRVYARRLTSILVEAGVVTSEQVDAGLSRQRTTGRKIGESLVEMGVATEEDIGWALAHQLDLTFVDLSLEALDHDLVRSFPDGMLERLEAVPLVVSDPTLTIALADPLDQEIVAELERAAGRPLSLAVATPSAIRRVLQAVLAPRRSRRARLADPVQAAHPDQRQDRSGPGFLASLLGDARRAGASEIHFLPRRGEIEVHHRVGSALVRVGNETPDVLDQLVIHLEKLGGPLADDRAMHAAGRVVCPVGAEAIELGISLLRQDEGTSLTLEVAPVTTRPPALDELGLDPLDLASLRAALDAPAGLGVVAGPPRSGGSTTLACLFAEAEVAGRRCLSFAPRPHRNATDTRAPGPPADAGVTWAEAAVAQCADIVTLDGVLDGDAVGAALSSRAAGRLVLLHTDWTAGVSPERMATITDGTSNTLLAGERSTRTTLNRGTFWADSFNLYSLSGAYNQSASMLADYDACSRVASDVAQCKYGWGAYHPNIVNFVYGDGSVRPVTRSIDMKIFTYLATIGNGETTQGD